MKGKNIFDVLENTDSSVIDRLAAEFPPQDNKEKERIFKMSERKFNTKIKNISNADEQSVGGVEIYKKPKWQRFLSIAAAFAIVAGGITGGAYALKHLKGTHSITTTSEDEIDIATPTEPAQVSNCPFDFAAHNFYLADPESKTHIEIYLNMPENETTESEEENISATCFHLIGGNDISLEKRQKLAEFFNGWNWEECDESYYPPQWLYTYERRGLFCIEDSQAFIISFEKDTNALFFTQLQIKLRYDSDSDEFSSLSEDRYITYDAISEPSSFITKSYKIDYDLFISKISEVLGDDFGKDEQSPWNFLNKEWALQTDEHDTSAALSANERNSLYNMLRKRQFKEEEGRNESLSTAEAMDIYNNTPPAETDKYVILTSNYFDYHDIIYFEQYDDKTVVRYYDYGVQGANIPGEEYRVNIYNYTCDDADLVTKIKECLNNNTAVEVPVDLSIVDEVKWLYTSFDTRSFNISDDKMKKIGECLKKYNWSMIDKNSYFGYDISIIGEWKNYLVDLQIGKGLDENTIITFRIGEPSEMDGHKFLGATVDNALEFGNKLYISSDKNAYNELEKILSE